MREEGYVDEVSVIRLGSFLAVDATGAVLEVEDASDFEESGYLTLNGTELEYDGVDYDTNQIYLVDALANSALAEDEVLVAPESIIKQASIITSEDDEPITATVSNALFDRLPEGIREDEVEAVAIELVGDTWYVTDILGQEPSIDGSYLSPGSVTLAELDPGIDLGGITTSIGDNAPSNPTEGDIWVDTANGREMKRFDGGTWTSIQDQAITAALTDALNAANLADSKMSLYYSDSEPTLNAQGNALNADNDGDLWFDTDDQNHPYRYDAANSTWVSIRDGAIDAAQDAADEAKEAALPDGIAPSVSPAPTVIGGVGALHVKWNPLFNHDPVTYEVHVSTTSGFTPSASTLVGETMGGSLTVKRDGAGSALAYGTNYNVRVIAKDADGMADPSDQASAQLVQVGNAEISAEYAYFGDIAVNQLTGGKLSADVTLAATIKTAESGARVEQDASGIRVYDSNDVPTTVFSTDGESTFKGNVEASSLTVRDGMSVRSANNELAESAVLRMARGITASQQPPSVVQDWSKTQLKDANGQPTEKPFLGGLFYTSTGKWLAATGQGLHEWNTDGTYYREVPNTSGAYVSAVEINGIYYGIYISNSGVNVRRFTETTVSVDTFTDLNNWTSYGTASANSGRAKLTAQPGTTSGIKQTVNQLAGHAVSAKVDIDTAMPGAQVVKMRVQNNAANHVSMWYSRGKLYMTMVDGSTIGSTPIVYNPTEHAYWRIAASNGVVSFLTSSDGQDWVLQSSETPSWSLTNLEWSLETTNPAAGANLLSNGDFESNVGGWSSWGGSVNFYQVNNLQHSGNHSMGVTTGSGSNARRDIISDVAPAIAGRSYDFSYWAMKGTSSTVSVTAHVIWYDSNGDEISRDSQQHTLDTSFTQSAFQVTAPSNAATVRVGIATTTTGGGPTYYVDDVELTEVVGSPVDQFFDDAVVARPAANVGWSHNHGKLSALTVDGSNLAVITGKSSGYDIHHVDPQTMIPTMNIETLTEGGGHALSAYRGSADFGGNRWVIADADSDSYQVFLDDDNYSQESSFKQVPNAVGIGWDGTNFYSVDFNGHLHKHEANNTWAWNISSDWEAGFTWSDGTNETDLSVTSSFVAKKRARLTVTSPALPVGNNAPDRIKVYLKRASDSDFHYQDTSATGTQSVVITAPQWSTGQPPATNGYAAGLPSSIRSSSDELVLEATGAAKVKSLEYTELIGEIKMWPTTTAPDGFLVCDGSTFSNSEYPELANLLGGTTLPDYSGRMPRGGTPGTSGGSETKDLSHNHSIGSDGEHNHSVGYNDTNNTSTGGGAKRVYNVFNNTGNAGSHNHGGSTGSSLGNQDIMPPWFGITFIIRAK